MNHSISLYRGTSAQQISGLAGIAEAAITQMECAKEQIGWLRSVLQIVRDETRRRPGLEHYSSMLTMAIGNADDIHNQLDHQVVELGSQISAEAGRVQA